MQQTENFPGSVQLTSYVVQQGERTKLVLALFDHESQESLRVVLEPEQFHAIVDREGELRGVGSSRAHDAAIFASSVLDEMLATRDEGVTELEL